MSVKTKFWQTWLQSDMAESDNFHTSKTAMLKFVHESYGVRGPGKPDEHGFLNWDIMGQNYEGKKIATDCVMAHEFEVEMTKEGICSALKYIPCR